MAWYDDLLNLIHPKPAAQGMRGSYVPNLAAPKTLTADGAAADKYGNLAELLSDVGNISDCWVTGISVSTPSAAGRYGIALSREVAGGAPAAIEVDVPAFAETTVLADFHEVIPIFPPVYFPSGTGIRAALAGPAAGKTLDVWAIIRRGL